VTKIQRGEREALGGKWLLVAFLAFAERGGVLREELVLAGPTLEHPKAKKQGALENKKEIKRENCWGRQASFNRVR